MGAIEQKADLYRRVGARIRAARQGQHLSLRELAERLGVKYQSIQHWESGKHMPRLPEMQRLCAALGTSEQELFGNDRALARDYAAYATGVADSALSGYGMVRRVPVISWVAASTWCGSGDPHPVGQGDEFENVPGVGPRCFALKVRGPSMEPTFPDGCLIVVDPDRAPVSGSYVVAKIPNADEVTFKRLVIDAGRQQLQPLNPQFAAFDLPPEGVICGVVVRMIQRF